MDPLIVFIARYSITFSLLATGYLLLKQSKFKQKEMIILLICGGFLSLIFAKVGAHFYFQARPFIGDNVKPLFIASHVNGFPSDHTLLASFLGFAAFRYSKKYGVALLILAALIGWARVAAGVHHLLDIVGAFVFTGLAYLIVTWLLNARNSRRSEARQNL